MSGICRYEIRFNFLGQAIQTTFVNAGSYYQAREIFQEMYPAASLGSILYQSPSRELNYMPGQSESNEPRASTCSSPIWGRMILTLYGSIWRLTLFRRRHPNVKAEYLSTNEYNTQKHIQLIEQAIAMKPDGLVVSVTDAAALDGVLRQAISQGIPVVAFNTPDLRYPARELQILPLSERIIIRMERRRPNTLWSIPSLATLQGPNGFSASTLTLLTADWWPVASG